MSTLPTPTTSSTPPALTRLPTPSAYTLCLHPLPPPILPSLLLPPSCPPLLPLLTPAVLPLVPAWFPFSRKGTILSGRCVSRHTSLHTTMFMSSSLLGT